MPSWSKILTDASALSISNGGTGVSSSAAIKNLLNINTNSTLQLGELQATTIEQSGNPVLDEGTSLNDIGGTLQSSKLDSDTAHLSGTQTFTGDKSFTGRVVITDSEPTLTVVNNTPTNAVVAIKVLSTGNTMFTVKAGGATKCQSLGVGTDSSNTSGEIRATNEITAYYSDDRLKTKSGNIKDSLDKVCSLNGFHYQPNEVAGELGYDTSKKKVGVSAQEVLKVLPEAVVPAPIDPKYHTVQYDKLVPLLIESIKELTAKVKRLEDGNS